MFRTAFVVLGIAWLAGCAQEPARPAFEPHSGQAGKDVVWVPTPQALVDKMLDMAEVTPKDYVMDLGSGDGRTVITAARRGAKALGVEYNPDMVALSKHNAEREGVADKTRFVKADLFETDFSQATVITMFLLPTINMKLRPKLLALKPGTRIVSNSFTMEDWEADETQTIPRDGGCNSGWCTAYLWVVPARFEGSHRLPTGELTLKQEFQFLHGSLRTANGTFEVNGKVRGEEAFFTANLRPYHVKLKGNSLELLP